MGGGDCKVTKVGATEVKTAAGRRLANKMKVAFEISKVSPSQKAASEKAWNSGGTDAALNKAIAAELAKPANKALSDKMGTVTSKKVVIVTTTTPSDSAWHKTVGLSLFALVASLM